MTVPDTRPLSPAMAFIMRYRMQISFVIFTILLVVNVLEGRRPHSVSSLADPVGLAGAVIALFGAFVRSWAAGVIHKEDKLATSGPYFFLRHPLYFGSLLMAVGVIMIVGDPKIAAAVAALILVIYLPKVRNEEAALGRKFGSAWRDYIAVTPRMFPRLAWPGSWGDWSSKQWLFNREYNALFGSMFALLVLEIWHNL